ncbi:hypothetical protein [Streptomyces sp. NPDC014623]|uniref:hypothetical protein n=1 Tax=Streptomyces sp. NPDC014623 TaxID=3364875 RepID=UPI0036F98979
MAAVAGPAPLEELHGGPFPLGTRSRHAACARRAAGQGHVVTRRLRVHGPRPGHHALRAGADRGRLQLSVAPGARVLARAAASVPDFAAERERRGARLEFTGPEGLVRTEAGVRRRPSVPTAGYDG